jgi:hypothetical protein
MIADLAAAPVNRRVGALSATHAIIRKQAGKRWSMQLVEGDGFAIRTVGTTVVFSRSLLCSLLGSVRDQLLDTDDLHVRRIMAKLGRRPAATRASLRLLVLMFLAHEFLHIEQQLGSDQYVDSDEYMDAVAAVDYQADVAAISYVAALGQHEGVLTKHELLTLLTTLHIMMMNAFAQKVSRPDFDRLLLWHFQSARIARSEDVEDMLHPALQNRPVISLPALNGVAGDELTPESFNLRRNEEPGTKLDIVVAAADGSGIVRLFRMAASDPERVRRLAGAIVMKDLGSVRRELEEFFLTHAAAMGFRRPSDFRIALDAALAIGEELRKRDGRIDAEDRLVADFFVRVEFLLEQLPKSRIQAAGLSDWHDKFVNAGMSILAGTSSGSSDEQNADKVTQALHAEILRVLIRLSSVRDGLDAEEG